MKSGFPQFSNSLVMQPMPGIGDMIWFLPHVRAIADHFSTTGSVSLLARPSTHATKLLSEEKSIKNVIPLYRSELNRQGKERDPNHSDTYRHDGVAGIWRLARDLSSYHFDAAWILDRHARYVVAAVLAGIPNRFGLGFGAEKIFLKHPTLPKIHHKTHARDRATRLLKMSKIDISAYEYPLSISKEAAQKAGSAFQKNALWACFGVGASEKEKKWPAACFATVIKALCLKGIICFICGGPDEAQEVQEIKNLAGKDYASQIHGITNWNVMETAALMTKSDFYVGNDTFLYNLAALQGKQALSISGVVPSHMYRKEMMTVRSEKGVEHVGPEVVLDKLHQETFLVSS
jgi:heptosyltransferase-2